MTFSSFYVKDRKTVEVVFRFLLIIIYIQYKNRVMILQIKSFKGIMVMEQYEHDRKDKDKMNGKIFSSSLI